MNKKEATYNPCRSTYLAITGLPSNVEREDLRQHFQKYGKIIKVYRSPNKPYGSVYFENLNSLEAASKDMDTPWELSIQKNTYKKPVDTETEELNETTGYCDIHGNDVTVLEDPEGRLFVPLSDVRRAGFSLFRKDNFDTVLVSTDQIKSELNLFILSEIKRFLIKNKICCVDDKHIVNCIERSKALLMGQDIQEEPKKPERSVTKNGDSFIITKAVNKTTEPDIEANRRSTPENGISTSFKTEGPRRVSAGRGRAFKDNASKSSSDNESVKSLGSYEKVKLGEGKQTVLVTHVEAPLIFYAQLMSNFETIQQLNISIGRAASKALPVSKPIKNHLYLAEFEDCWYRALYLNPNVIKFIDYGNISGVSKLKHLPDNLKDIPFQAIKMHLVEGSAPKPISPDINLSVTQLRANPDGSIQIRIESPNKIEVFCKKPPFKYKLTPNEKVLILGFCPERNVLFLRSMECATAYANIMSLLKKIKEEKVLNPKLEQVVLVVGKSETRRGIVKELLDDRVRISWIDFGGEVIVPSGALRNVDKQLAELPPALIVSPELGLELKKTKKGVLEELIAQQIKCFVRIKGDKFDLELSGGISLTEKLSTHSISKSQFFFSDLNLKKAETGLKTYTCTNFESSSEITLIPDDIPTEHLIALEDIEDPEPYEPVLDELCLGRFEDLWYRGACIQELGGKFKIYFFDYGNTEDLTKEDIRKISKELKEVPVYAISCRIDGFKGDVGRLKELMMGNEVEAKIVKFDELGYVIEVPQIMDILKEGPF